MTNRSVTVELKALVSSYVANMKQAGVATREFAAKGAQYVQDHSAELNQLGNQAALTGAAIMLGVGKAVKTYADFDREMSRVRSTGDDARQSIDGLRATAVKLGADTQYSAQEAAQGITDMLKAGMSAKDVIGGGLSGALALAASDQLDVAFAAETTAVALQQFKLEGSQASHVADLLAAGAGKAMGGVTELAQALKYVGPVAAGMNISIEETVGTLSAFASEGILADQAGTSLRGVLSSLTSPSKAAQKEMDRLGISLYDQQGKFLGLANMAGQMEQAYAGATDAEKDMSLGILFGNQQITAARILLKQGEDGLRDWTDQVNDAGFAQRQAAEMTNNLSGDLERLGGSIDTVFIQGGGGANRVLRNMAQGAESVVDWIGQLPAPLLETVTMLTGAGGLATVGVGGMLKLAAAAGDAKRNFATLGISARGASIGIGAASLALTIGVSVLAAHVQKQALAERAVEDFTEAIKADTGALGENTRAAILNQVSAQGLVTTASKMGISSEALTDAFMGNADAVEYVNGKMVEYLRLNSDNEGAISGAKTEVDQLAGAMGDVSGQLATAKSNYEDYRAEVEKSAEANDDATDSEQKHTAQLLKQAEAAQEVQQQINDLIESLYGVRDANSAILANESSLEAAIDSARDAIDKKNLAVLKGADINNLNNPTIRDANDALRDIANSATAYSKELLEQGKSQGYADSQMRIAAAAIMDQAKKWGLSKKEVLEFTESVTGVPKSVLTTITVKGARQAEEFLQAVEDGVVEIPDDKAVTVSAAIATGSWKKVKAAVAELPQEQQFEVLTQLKDQGFKDADTELTKLAKRLAKKYEIDVDGKSAKQTLRDVKAELDRIRDKEVTVRVRQESRNLPKADGGILAGLVQQFASGGQWGQPQVRPFQGAAGVQWGEQGSGPWEAFISGAPQKRDRSIAIWREVGRRLLGGFSAEDVLQQFASGGVLDLEDQLEVKRLQIQIRDLQRDLKAKEKYRPNKKSKKTATRYKLRGLDREAAKLELRIAQQDLKELKAKPATDQKAAKAEQWASGIDRLTGVAGDKLRELQAIAGSVTSSLGGFDMKSLVSSAGTSWRQSTDASGNVWHTSTTTSLSAASITQAAQARAAKVGEFTGKLQRLLKAGMSAAALEPIWRMGVDDGTIVADAYLADLSQISGLNSAYASMDAWTGSAAQSITEASYAGGLSAAEAMVKTLESAGANIGKELAQGFASSLGYSLSPASANIAELVRVLASSTGASRREAGALTKRAGGGPADADQWYLVGEQGPELMVPRRDAWILNNSQSRPVLQRFDQPGYGAPGGSVTQVSRTVNVYVTTHNPQAEPTSYTIDRALAYAAAGSGDQP